MSTQQVNHSRLYHATVKLAKHLYSDIYIRDGRYGSWDLITSVPFKSDNSKEGDYDEGMIEERVFEMERSLEHSASKPVKLPALSNISNLAENANN